jgi:SM-20-related protein
MSPTIDFTLNPDLDVAHFARLYAENGLVQIPDILSEEAANAVHDLLARQISWRLAFVAPRNGQVADYGSVVCLNQAEIQALGRDGLQQMLAGVMEMARENIGFLYSSYPMIQAWSEGWDPGHPIHKLTEFMNSPAFLDFGRQVIGTGPLTKADCQATLYSRGQFLTRHRDDGMNNERRAAYTFGFTRNWQTDWGGLLMFLDDRQDVERALMPRFNMLSLFDGRKIHSVSPVSPFAGTGRYQITGWLRDDPPAFFS